jgi:hypothetical protein
MPLNIISSRNKEGHFESIGLKAREVPSDCKIKNIYLKVSVV